MQRSVLDYAAPAWQPWLSKTQLNKLEVSQNSALRIISGQYKSTPVEALRLETGIPSYETVSKRHTAKSYEKAKRLPANHPRAEALNSGSGITHRIKTRSSWREEANKVISTLPIANLSRADITNPITKPWSTDADLHQWKVILEIPVSDIKNKTNNFSIHPNNSPWSVTLDQDQSKDPMTEHAIRAIDSFNVDTVIYIYGSCTAGTTDGGSAAVVTTGSARNPIVLETLQKNRSSLHMLICRGRRCTNFGT